MAISREMRLLDNKWKTNTGWPKRLEWMEIQGVRGWTGQRIDFRFPIVAICGENGSGKSTILQCAAASYFTNIGDRTWFASDFLPDTAWEKIENAQIRVSAREGNTSHTTSVRKPGERWRGNPDRRERPVIYLDLSRIQPQAARVGFARLAKSTLKEIGSTAYGPEQIERLSKIMGRSYAGASMALTDADDTRTVSVLTLGNARVSGFHQGMGELTIAEFLKSDPPRYSLVLIDEVETSLHPRAQRRLVRDLADLARLKELQILLTTHSPYVLAELPPEARGYILRDGNQRDVVLGVSPEFAMTLMDEEQHPECDLYVEDERAAVLLKEMLVAHAPQVVSRIQCIPYGAASVGQALGQMATNNRFPRPTLVFLDGDQPPQPGCSLLPGTDAPERVVFGALSAVNWNGLEARTGRSFANIADACTRAMTSTNHHEWIKLAADRLIIGGDVLWQAMCAQWATSCLTDHEARPTTEAVLGKLN